LTFQESKAESL